MEKSYAFRTRFNFNRFEDRFEIDHFLDNYAQIKQISFRLSMTS